MLHSETPSEKSMTLIFLHHPYVYQQKGITTGIVPLFVHLHRRT